MAKVARTGAPVVAVTLAMALTPLLGGPAPAGADVVREREWALQAMHAPQAWHYSRGQNITVAVLDTGVYPGNPDLAGRVTTGPDLTHSGRHPGSKYWGRHGTAMAGIIAGHGHGAGHSRGVLGIAPRARILSIRVTLEAGDPLRHNRAALNRTRNALASGIRYAADHGAKVISMSLGGGTRYYSGSQSERAAIEYARRKGAILVASAGNDGGHANRRTFPAAYSGVVAVGAVGHKLHRAGFSNRQRYVKVLAPGVGIVTTGGKHGYASTTGTSAATAFTAGTAALIRARYKRMTAPVVARALRKGTGRGETLDARRALFAAAKLKHAGGTGAAPTPAQSHRPVSSEASRSRQTLLYGALGGGALLLVIIAAIIVVVTRRRRLGDRARADANADPMRRRPDLGEVPPVAARGRMPDRSSARFGPYPGDPDAAPDGAFQAGADGPPGQGPGLGPGGAGAGVPGGGHAGAGMAGAGFAATNGHGSNGNGNGHGPVGALHPYVPHADGGAGQVAGADQSEEGPRLKPYSDVHPAAETESFGAVGTTGSGPRAPGQRPDAPPRSGPDDASRPPGAADRPSTTPPAPWQGPGTADAPPGARGADAAATPPPTPGWSAPEAPGTAPYGAETAEAGPAGADRWTGPDSGPRTTPHSSPTPDAYEARPTTGPHGPYAPPSAPYASPDAGVRGTGPQRPYGTSDSGLPGAPYAAPDADGHGTGPRSTYASPEAGGHGTGPRSPYARPDAGGEGVAFPSDIASGGGSGPQAPYGEQGGEFGDQPAMAPPPPLPPEPGEPPAPEPHPGEEPARPRSRVDDVAQFRSRMEGTAGRREPTPENRTRDDVPGSRIPHTDTADLPRLPPSGSPVPPPPPTVETPAPPGDRGRAQPPHADPPAYGETPRPYQSSGSVWDSPTLWADGGTAPFEAEARSDGTHATPGTERGTTGWATAAGWDTSTRPADGDDEDDRHL